MPAAFISSDLEQLAFRDSNSTFTKFKANRCEVFSIGVDIPVSVQPQMSTAETSANADVMIGHVYGALSVAVLFVQ